MARSVSYPTDCHAVCFRDVRDIEEHWEWDDFRDWIQDLAREAWPSLVPCDKWLDREDHAILENDHCWIGISEYCGLAAVWLKSKADDCRSSWYGDRQSLANLADHWCTTIADRFSKAFGEYRLIGRFSNGEAIYERIQQ